MKTKIFLFISTIIIQAVILTGCKKNEVQPTAGFTYSYIVTTPFNDGNYVDDPVSFTNISVDGDHYEWSFGNGKTSTEVSPSITYTAVGTYTVKLIAYSKSGKKSNEISKDIYIQKRRTGVFSATVNGGDCSGVLLQLGYSDIEATYPSPGLHIIGHSNPSIYLHVDNFTGTTGTFQLGGTNLLNKGTLSGCNNNTWPNNTWPWAETDNTYTGVVTITQVDPIKKQVFGTFSFNAYNPEKGVINVTNGSFSDINY